MQQPIPPALGGGADGASRRQALRGLLDREGPLVLPGVFDGLTGVLAEQAGFESCYLTGAGVANTQLAVPDVGLLSFDTVVIQALRLTAATNIPVIVDVDTGLGGPAAVMHVVRTLETIGVAGIQMEDQQMPKRCGHFDRKRVISASEMQAKVEAAVTARKDDNMIVIARTDALAIEGADSALQRAKAYREAGADIIFIEAPESREEIERIPQEIPDVPLLMNVVQGGKSPELSAADLYGMGYKVILHANLLMRAMVGAGQVALESLRRTGTMVESDLPFLSWDDRQSLVGLPRFDSLEDHFRARWSDSPLQDGNRT